MLLTVCSETCDVNTAKPVVCFYSKSNNRDGVSLGYPNTRELKIPSANKLLDPFLEKTVIPLKEPFGHILEFYSAQAWTIIKYSCLHNEECMW